METTHDGIHYVHWRFLHSSEDCLAKNSIDQDICKAVEDSDITDVKVTRNIILCVSNAIHIKILELEIAKEMWKLLWTGYSIPDIIVAFLLFKYVLDLCISSNQHPGKVLNQLQMYFMELKDAKFKLSTKTRIMLLLVKLPPKIEVVAQKVAIMGSWIPQLSG